jgi:hypothetical protein
LSTYTTRLRRHPLGYLVRVVHGGRDEFGAVLASPLSGPYLAGTGLTTRRE